MNTFGNRSISGLGDIGPHQSFIVPHRTTEVTMTLRKYQLFYSTYFSSSTLIKNGQLVIMTDYIICKNLTSYT